MVEHHLHLQMEHHLIYQHHYRRLIQVWEQVVHPQALLQVILQVELQVWLHEVRHQMAVREDQQQLTLIVHLTLVIIQRIQQRVVNKH